jgi:hypothetical protein
MHRLAHLLKWNTGKVISKTDDAGNTWIAFQCSGCGRITDAHIPM